MSNRCVGRQGDHSEEEWGRHLAFRDAYLALCREHGFYLRSCGCCCGTDFLTDEDSFLETTSYFLDMPGGRSYK